MSIEKMREEFEVWSANHDYFGGVETDRTPSGSYSDVDLHHAWESWQASCESLVIELPEKDPTGTGPGDCGDGRPSEEQYIAAHCNAVLAQFRKAIESAGLKVKS